MDTKLRGDIAEQAAVIHALKRGWGVLKPVGDRLAYDLAFDIELEFRLNLIFKATTLM
jgi:PD-(D/E)XK endonuclease